MLGVGAAFEYDVHPLEVDGFQDPAIRVKRLHILPLSWLQRSGDCEDGTAMDGDGRPRVRLQGIDGSKLRMACTT